MAEKVKYSLEEMNRAQKETDELTEQMRMLNESKGIKLTGSNAGDGEWSCKVPEFIHENTKVFLLKQYKQKLTELKKITG